MDFIAFGFIIAVALLIIAIMTKEYVMTSIAGIFFMLLGVYILNWNFVGLHDNLVLAVGIISIASGFYMLVHSSLELLEGGK